METIINEILVEWNMRHTEMVDNNKEMSIKIDKLKEILEVHDFWQIRKFFTPAEKTRKRRKKSTKKEVNINKEKNIAKQHIEIENIIFSEKQKNIINIKCPSLTDLSKVKEINILKKESIKEKSIKKEAPLVEEETPKEEPENPFNTQPTSETPQNAPVKKIKNILECLKSKSKKKVEQNKENIMEHSIIIEDGEIKFFKNKEKKRLKEYLKETKKKQEPKTTKQEDSKIIKKEDLKTVKKEEPKAFKQKKPFDMVYDVGTNKFINQPEQERPKKETSPVKPINRPKAWTKDIPTGDGLYKQIIDKERFKSRSMMNSYKPKTTIPEMSSDDEDSYVGSFIPEENLEELISKQNHEEIQKYFCSEMSIDIEMLFPNIQDVSNNSPNKWV
ncbi:hypothetical protein NGRA_2206 [Nosema granulosis]|uniref:Inner centromere protein ARK-binding domain-containing protein n=1 Tax=Nosema granulosis TaxID=83296 RepID=A0A9P6GX40_9MICR|nr:hypothetical protein NGRA_2206 [Nosema granulosis]